MKSHHHLTLKHLELFEKSSAVYEDISTIIIMYIWHLA